MFYYNVAILQIYLKARVLKGKISESYKPLACGKYNKIVIILSY